jgi:hypothetical protein
MGEDHLTLTQNNTQAVQQLAGLIPCATYVLSGFIRNNPGSEPGVIRLGVRYNEDNILYASSEEAPGLAK